MLFILKNLRKNHLLNFIVRNTLRKLRINKRATSLWPTSGVVSLKVENVEFKFYSECDDYLMSQLYYRHDFESYELKIFIELMKSSRTFFDIGSNTGLYTILASKINRDTKIIAFEPHPGNFTRLQYNLRLNNISSVVVHNVAISSETGFASFFIPFDDSISVASSFDKDFSERIFPKSHKSINVKKLTLDNFNSTEGLKVIDLIKLDVECHELEVLMGAKSLLKNMRPLILCEIFTESYKDEAEFQRSLPKVHQMEKILKKLNYSFYAIEDNFLTLLDTLNISTQRDNHLLIPNERGKDRRHIKFSELGVWR